MYDRHKNIIKWYEYDASKLMKNVEAETVAEPQSEQPVMEMAEEPNVEATAPVADMDPSMASEVERIMAAFTSAKQDGVDSVFATINS